MESNGPDCLRHLRLDPANGAVADAVFAAGAFAQAIACDADRAAKLAIIVEELIANIVEHGGVHGGERIALTLSRQAGKVTVRIADSGTHYDPRAAPAPAELPPERGGGAGIALVLAWAESVDYRRVADQNELTLELPLR